MDLEGPISHDIGQCITAYLPGVNSLTLFLGYSRWFDLTALLGGSWPTVRMLALDLRGCGLDDRSAHAIGH